MCVCLYSQTVKDVFAALSALQPGQAIEGPDSAITLESLKQACKRYEVCNLHNFYFLICNVQKGTLVTLALGSKSTEQKCKTT